MTARAAFVVSGSKTTGYVPTVQADGTIQWAAASGTPSGAAGGDLAGTYPNPTIGGAKVTPAKLSASLSSAGLAPQVNAAGTGWNAVKVQASQAPDLCLPFWLSLTQAGTFSAAPYVVSTARGCRFVAPRDGTITAVAAPLTTSSGNLDLAMLDTTATTRNVTHKTGSIACPSVAAAGLTVLASGLSWSVTAGQQFDVAVVFDNGTAASTRAPLIATALNQLPSGWMTAGVTSGSPKQALTWLASVTVGSWGTTLAESSITAAAFYPLYLLLG